MRCVVCVNECPRSRPQQLQGLRRLHNGLFLPTTGMHPRGMSRSDNFSAFNSENMRERKHRLPHLLRTIQNVAVVTLRHVCVEQPCLHRNVT